MVRAGPSRPGQPQGAAVKELIGAGISQTSPSNPPSIAPTPSDAAAHPLPPHHQGTSLSLHAG